MSQADHQDSFETVFTRSTAGFFLREFCFSNTEFSPPNRSEIELADFVIQLDDLLMIFQVKTRERASTDPDRERAWFEDKVIGKATRQVRDTVMYLRDYTPEILNDRGRRVALPSGVDTATIIKIVVFNGGSDLPLDCARRRFHESRTVGFIHMIAAADWRDIMHTFVTPREIADYLRMRERVSHAHAAQVRAVSEKALIGQFIAQEETTPPTSAFEGVVDRLVDDRASFDILRFLNLFGDRIISDVPPGTTTPADLRGADVDYYPIIRELAKLPRTDVAAFRERFELAWLRAGQYFDPPFMRMVASTGVGFVFSPVPEGLEAKAQNGLANFVAAHMYEQRITRCIGAALVNEGTSRFIWWMMVDRAWKHDPEIELLLLEHPLSKVRESIVPRYRLVEDKSAMGDETEKISPQDQERITKLMLENLNTPERSLAIHEAGHAVVALHLGLKVISVSLGAIEKEGGESLGRLRTPPLWEGVSDKEIAEHSETVLSRAFNWIAVLEAGREARKQIQGKSPDVYAQIDDSEIARLLKQFPELQKKKPSPREVCADVVTGRCAAIKRVAEGLLRHQTQTLTGDEVTVLL